MPPSTLSSFKTPGEVYSEALSESLVCKGGLLGVVRLETGVAGKVKAETADDVDDVEVEWLWVNDDAVERAEQGGLLWRDEEMP